VREAKKAVIGLATAWLLIAAALASGCTHMTDGRPVCPGCGSLAEPSFPTPRPTPPTATAAPPTSPGPAPAPTATAAPPGGAVSLPPEDGHVYVETKSGKTRCQISDEAVGCESEFTNSPMVDGEHANGVSVTAGGDMRWILGNLGDVPVVTLDYRTYLAEGWTIAASSSGTRFTNDHTGHGMFVSIEKVDAF
jgi:hypothetical protein